MNKDDNQVPKTGSDAQKKLGDEKMRQIYLRLMWQDAFARADFELEDDGVSDKNDLESPGRAE